MGTGYNPRIVTDGLVLCLDAANARSYPGTGTTWTDLKGGNSGTLTNGPTFSSDNGGSIVFDGTNDYVNVPTNDDLDIRGDITLTAWAYKDGNNGGYPYFINKSNSNSNTQYLLGWSTNTAIPFYSMGKNIVLNPNNVGVNLNEWVYYAGTRIGDFMTIYINGERAAGPQYLSVNSSAFSSADVRIGTLGWTGQSWNGKIGPLCIYNKGLSDEQIRQNYLATKERYA